MSVVILSGASDSLANRSAESKDPLWLDCRQVRVRHGRKPALQAYDLREGSFDCVAASRSEAATPLRMTELAEC